MASSPRVAACVGGHPKKGMPNLQGWQPYQPTSKGGGTGGNQTNNEAGIPAETFSFGSTTTTKMEHSKLSEKGFGRFILELIGTGHCLQGCIDPH